MVDMKLLKIIENKIKTAEYLNFLDIKVPTVLDDMLADYIVLHDLPAYTFRMIARDRVILYYMRSLKDGLQYVVFQAHVPFTLKPVKRARLQRRSR